MASATPDKDQLLNWNSSPIDTPIEIASPPPPPPPTENGVSSSEKEEGDEERGTPKESQNDSEIQGDQEEVEREYEIPERKSSSPPPPPPVSRVSIFRIRIFDLANIDKYFQNCKLDFPAFSI